MKKNNLLLLLAALAVAGCCCSGYRYDDGIEYVSDDGAAQYAESAGYAGYDVSGDASDCGACSGQQVIRYSVPNDTDLRLESAHHVIEVDGLPNKKYDYYVWTGEKTYNDAPDLIVQDGAASIRVEQ